MAANIVQSGPTSISGDDFVLSVNVLCGVCEPVFRELFVCWLTLWPPAFVTDDITVRKRFRRCKISKCLSSYGIVSLALSLWHCHSGSACSWPVCCLPWLHVTLQKVGYSMMGPTDVLPIKAWVVPSVPYPQLTGVVWISVMAFLWWFFLSLDVRHAVYPSCTSSFISSWGMLFSSFCISPSKTHP